MALVIENNDIDFSKVSLGIPNQLQANSFFSRIYFNNNPFIIQAPQCITSNGIKKYKNKIVSELIFINGSEGTNDFYNFFIKLENIVKESLLNNKDDWFEDDVTIDDIDESFQSPLLFHDKGIKIKAYIQQNNLDNSIKFNCYDINHNIISNDLFTTGINFIPIFEIVGCKFSNKFFTIEIRLLQALIVNSIVDNSKPLFSSNTKISNTIHDVNNNDNNDRNSNDDNDSDIDINSEVTKDSNIDIISDDTKNSNVENNSLLNNNFNLDNQDNLNKDLDLNDHSNVKKDSDVVEEKSEVVEEKSEVVEDDSEVVENDSSIENNNYLDNNDIKENINDINNKSNDDTQLNNLDKNIQEDSDDESQINLNDNSYDIDNINKNIEEVSLDLEYLDNNPVKLKTHADIYHEIWKLYRDEAYKHRRQNLKTYLNSRNIISNILINEL